MIICPRCGRELFRDVGKGIRHGGCTVYCPRCEAVFRIRGEAEPRKLKKKEREIKIPGTNLSIITQSLF